MSPRTRTGSRAPSPEVLIPRSPKKASKALTPHAPGKVPEQPKPTRTLKRRCHRLASAPQIGTHMFFLFVGEITQPITIHSALLAAATRTYLDERFIRPQLCYIPEEDPEIAQLWRLFLYTGKIFSLDKSADQDTRDDGEQVSHADGEWTKLAHAYLFGQVIKDEAFANACVTAMIEKVKATERFPSGIAAEVYGYTQPGDKLRRLIVDLHVWMGEGTCLAEPHEDADGPEVFQEDVEREMAKAERVGFEGERDWVSKPCTYHEHALTRKC